ncbi:MAG: hypothetical protein PWR01_4055 [Clostridiales bacterium]|nr:hypothetical protein [Clostridiales bacterium]MDN5282982.1 hypothetical protein [Candidatus Ozemobacter sp.]
MKLPIQHERLNRTIDRGIDKIEELLVLIRKYLLTGILVLVPMAVTIYIMFFVFQVTDGLLGVAVAKAIGYRIPGMGLFLTALICILAGMIAQNYVGRRFLSGIEGSLEKIPVVRSLYNGIKQVADVVVQKNRGEFKRVVMVEYPKENSWTLGFVTADFTVPLRSKQIDERKMATVFIPTTPNPTSGFLLIIEKSRIVDTHMDIEEAMKVVISGGLVQPGRLPEGAEEAKVEEFSIPH